MRLRSRKKAAFVVLAAAALVMLLAGCPQRQADTTGGGPGAPSGKSQQGPALSGMIVADGSSTVYPITEAVAEEFGKIQPGVKVTVGISGTGGGFKKFGTGETDISDASRPIKESEAELCKQNGIEYVELPVAYDALTVVVNSQNNWCESITVGELKKLWEPAAQGNMTKWSQVRKGWPDKPIRLFGPGVDSGTFDYFTEAVVGKAQSSRGDFTASEDDNVLVQGVAGDTNALGYFGVAYYQENKDKLKAVAVDDGNDANGKAPVLPTMENVINGTYQPLARPLFIYVKRQALDRPEVKAFVEFYLNNVAELAREVGYIPLQDEVYDLASQRLEKSVTGSVFTEKGAQVGVRLEDLLQIEGGR